MTGIGRVQLTKAIYNFTDTQDIRFRLGYETFIDQKGTVTGVSSFMARANLSKPDSCEIGGRCAALFLHQQEDASECIWLIALHGLVFKNLPLVSPPDDTFDLVPMSFEWELSKLL